MKISSTSYRKPFLYAVVFHALLLVFFLLRWQVNNEVKMESSPNEIVQATLALMPPAAHVSCPSDLSAPKPVKVKPDNPLPPVKVESVQSPPKPKPVVKSEPVITAENPTPVIMKSEPKPILSVKKPDPVVTQPVIQKAAPEKKPIEEKQKKLQDDLLRQMENEKNQEKMRAKKQQQKEMERLLEHDLAQTPAKSSATQSHIATKTGNRTEGLDNKDIDRYKGLIISAISHRWIVPESVKKGLECRLAVRVAPGGVVTQVKLLKSSGDAALDHSAEAAVYKASPLPVPKEGALFTTFREFNLIVRPEGILGVLEP
jgi:colicin import membrane protein